MRPRKIDGTERAKLQIYTNPQTLELWKEGASAAGKTLPDWARTVLTNAAIVATASANTIPNFEEGERRG